MKPSKKAIVRAAERICADNGTAEEASEGWKSVALQIAARVTESHRLRDLFDTARLAMLQSIIEGNDVQSAQIDALKAVDL